jgi:hypothetical protein
MVGRTDEISLQRGGYGVDNDRASLIATNRGAVKASRGARRSGRLEAMGVGDRLSRSCCY